MIESVDITTCLTTSPQKTILTSHVTYEQKKEASDREASFNSQVVQWTNRAISVSG